MTVRLIGLFHLSILSILAFKGLALQLPPGHAGPVITVLLLLPGLAVLPGLWLARPNTIVWTALIALLYLTIAITDAWALESLRWINLLIALLCTALFLTAWWHLRALRRSRLKTLSQANESQSGG
ncbi:MAG: DUF2069 domain-containing protein [Halothiobacillaceae bacterium]